MHHRAAAISASNNIESGTEEAVYGKVAFPRADKNGARVSWINRDRADGERCSNDSGRGVVYQLRPCRSTIQRAIDTALRRANIGDERIRRIDGNGRDAPAHGITPDLSLTVWNGKRAPSDPGRLYRYVRFESGNANSPNRRTWKGFRGRQIFNELLRWRFGEGFFFLLLHGVWSRKWSARA